MHADPLHVTLLLLAAGVLAVVTCRSLGLSSTLGYLAAGAALGPHALGWLADVEHTRLLGEMGVVFLMFVVGLEFSLPALLASRRSVLGLGGAQVTVTGLLAGVVAWFAGESLTAAIVVGGALAMSSTAIVVKQLGEQTELATPHGRLMVGVLVFQDIATLPFLVLLPRLAEGGGGLDAGVALLLAKAVAVFVLLVVVGRRVLRRALRWIARHRSSELFMLTALLGVVGAAALAEWAGLSPPFGAFLAGLVLGESEFRYQIEADIHPFQQVLLGLFFAGVGMALDPAVFALHWLEVLAVFAALVFGKALLIAGLARAFGEPAGVAVHAGVGLGQGGEFGLLLVSTGLALGVLRAELAHVLLASIVLTMAAAPVLLRYAGAIARWVYRTRPAVVSTPALDTKELQGHVVMCGFGRTGQGAARVLSRAGRRYVALDLDADRVHAARAAGEPVLYGDAARAELLFACGIERASALAVTFDDTGTALRIVQAVRDRVPDVPVLVRCRDDARLEALYAAGATEVLTEDLEGSLMLGAQLLLVLGVPAAEVDGHADRIRADRYREIRRFFHGREDCEGIEDNAFMERLTALTVPDAFHGRTLEDLRAELPPIEVLALVRGGVRLRRPRSEDRLRVGDVVLVCGSAPDLEALENRFGHS